MGTLLVWGFPGAERVIAVMGTLLMVALPLGLLMTG
jgi:hypothetical protein